jgi:hypothetical protein
MPRNPHDFETDPGRYQRGERELEEHGRDGRFDPDDADVEPDRSVARYADEADEADEAEIAEEDILEIADLEDELDAQKGDDSDA